MTCFDNSLSLDQQNIANTECIVKPFLAGLFLLALGIFLSALGWQAYANITQTLKTMIPTSGKVVDMNPRIINTNSGDKTFYYPIVEFQTAAGETIRFENEQGGNPPAYQIGDQVDVRYNPQRPQVAMVTSWEIWLPTALFGFAGGLLILIGGLIFVTTVASLLKQ
jgi:hypothetical protein